MEKNVENEIPAHLFARIFNCGAELGATAALVKTGHLRPYLKKSEAFRLYGRKHVEHWIDTGLVTPRKDGDHSAAWRIDRIEIESVNKALGLLRYL
jgi:hypothetical protein